MHISGAQHTARHCQRKRAVFPLQSFHQSLPQVKCRKSGSLLSSVRLMGWRGNSPSFFQTAKSWERLTTIIVFLHVCTYCTIFLIQDLHSVDLAACLYAVIVAYLKLCSNCDWACHRWSWSRSVRLDSCWSLQFTMWKEPPDSNFWVLPRAGARCSGNAKVCPEAKQKFKKTSKSSLVVFVLVKQDWICWC